MYLFSTGAGCSSPVADIITSRSHQVIVARYPTTQFWLERHFDELFLVVNALFQRHYLFTYGMVHHYTTTMTVALHYCAIKPVLLLEMLSFYPK